MRTFLCFALFPISLFAANIEIKHEPKACLTGRSSMDLAIVVNGEPFKLDPSCSFSVTQSFRTKAGLLCHARTGMCTTLNPGNKLEVSCDDESRTEIPILCPKKQVVLIDSDPLACAKGKPSMPMSVSVGNEAFPMAPSCGLQFSKRLMTKGGVECRIESGMCSTFNPKNKFEVKCEGGPDVTTTIQCPS